MPLVACPCCGERTLTEERQYEICPICFWGDDPTQFDDPTSHGGATRESLEEARQKYQAIGASSAEWLRFVRPPTAREEQTR